MLYFNKITTEKYKHLEKTKFSKAFYTKCFTKVIIKANNFQFFNLINNDISIIICA